MMHTHAQKQSQPAAPVKVAGPLQASSEASSLHTALRLQSNGDDDALKRASQSQRSISNFAPDAKTPNAVGHTFSRVSIFPAIVRKAQPKLAVSTPGDEYEQEADQVTEQIMRMPEPKGACGCAGECDSCKAKQSSPPARVLQTKRVEDKDKATTVEPIVPSAVHEVLRSSGRPMDETTRSFMESRFGHDFSRVRIHTDAQAAASAQEMGALAYTVGSDVVFGSAQYAPHTTEGKRLLAHELTHVVQQQSSASFLVQRREAPGTSGRTATKECYVVYEHEVKVGGKPCWRFNNPGNVGREPSAKTDPSGAINHIGGGQDCGAGVGLYIFAGDVPGFLEIANRLGQAAQKQRFACEFLLSFSHEGQKYLDEITNRCVFLKGKMPSADKCSDEKGVNLASLDADQLSCIWKAIGEVECSYKDLTYSKTNAGETYTCKDTDDPHGVKPKLDC